LPKHLSPIYPFVGNKRVDREIEIFSLQSKFDAEYRLAQGRFFGALDQFRTKAEGHIDLYVWHVLAKHELQHGGSNYSPSQDRPATNYTTAMNCEWFAMVTGTAKLIADSTLLTTMGHVVKERFLETHKIVEIVPPAAENGIE